MVPSALQDLWPLSFGRKKKTRSFECTDADAFGYQELAGVRMMAGEDFVMNLHPQQSLTRWFLSRWSHTSLSKAQLWQTCPLMDLVNVEFSPIVRVLQYLALCLRGDATRLRLLLWERSHESFAEWVAKPSTADELAMLRLDIGDGIYMDLRALLRRWYVLALACGLAGGWTCRHVGEESSCPRAGSCAARPTGHLLHTSAPWACHSSGGPLQG